MNRELVKKDNNFIGNLVNDPLSGLRSTFDKFFDDMCSDRNKLWDTFDNKNRFPKSNIVQKDNGLLFEIAIPGYDKEEIEITYCNNYLTIKANKQIKEDNHKYFLREIRKSSFERKWKLDNIYDEDNINANIEQGMLTIFVPYSKDYLDNLNPKIKNIEIK